MIIDEPWHNSRIKFDQGFLMTQTERTASQGIVTSSLKWNTVALFCSYNGLPCHPYKRLESSFVQHLVFTLKFLLISYHLHLRQNYTSEIFLTVLSQKLPWTLCTELHACKHFHTQSQEKFWFWCKTRIEMDCSCGSLWIYKCDYIL